MHDIGTKILVLFLILLTAPFAISAPPASSAPFAAPLAFGPEELIRADGFDIDVPGFSVPSFVMWNGDDLPDLVVGEGGLGIDPGKVRVYLNTGTKQSPAFSVYFYAQSNGSDISVPSAG